MVIVLGVFGFRITIAPFASRRSNVNDVMFYLLSLLAAVKPLGTLPMASMVSTRASDAPRLSAGLLQLQRAVDN